MTRLCLICISAMLATACASVDTPDTGAAQPADDETQAAINDSSPDSSDIEMVDAPSVEQSVVEPPTLADNERVCRREKRTGSNRVMTVCRTRAEMKRLEEQSREVFQDLHDSQTQGGRTE